MVTNIIQCSNEISCYEQYLGLLHVFYLFAEILEAFSTPPVHDMTTVFTTTQINTISTTDGHQFSRCTATHDMSSVSSVKHTAASVNITQQSQSECLYSDNTSIIIAIVI